MYRLSFIIEKIYLREHNVLNSCQNYFLKSIFTTLSKVYKFLLRGSVMEKEKLIFDGIFIIQVQGDSKHPRPGKNLCLFYQIRLKMFIIYILSIYIKQGSL